MWPSPRPDDSGPYYWQRVNAAGSLHLQGPKAQQLLNQDISRCLQELDELKKLQAINRPRSKKDEYPAQRPAESSTFHGKDIRHTDKTTEAMKMKEEAGESPDDEIRAIHLPYKDLEGCMNYKGWERVDHVPYDIAEEDEEAYIKKIIGRRYQTRMLQRPPATR